MSEIKVYEGRKVVYTIKDNKVYEGNDTWRKVAYTIKENKIYEGNDTWRKVAYTIKDNKLYEGNDTWRKVAYTIKDNKVYEGNNTWSNLKYTLNWLNNGYNTGSEILEKRVENSITDKETNHKSNNNSNGGGCLSVILFFVIIVALAVSGKNGDKKTNKETVVEQAKSEFIFEDSDSRYLIDGEVMNLSKKKIRYAINEIYARRGRIFKDKKLNNYFSKKSWYKPRYTKVQFDESVFNEYERANINLLSKYR
ncbi:YARHG domain-containing protein [Eubacterium sp.]|uniref:YARHG domain-containing protein n=1 Tax=Eubacterium sp. TaxID=142586 RepID=UPI0025E30B39|nr:YARHG domain-containing protein [Eubacterium sp.]MCR5629083.1 YARHG domain-containing protein [Eubacterium sp.]